MAVYMLALLQRLVHSPESHQQVNRAMVPKGVDKITSLLCYLGQISNIM